MISVTDDTFQAEVAEADQPVIVEFTAPSRCAPCRAMVPVVESLADEHEEVKFVTVNPDENLILRAEYAIMTVPTFLRFENGEPTKSHVGSAPKGLLEKKLLS